jgi:transposase-like protein
MYCPKCKAENFSEEGTVNGRSLYSCAVCGYNLTIPVLPDSENTESKREAIILHYAGYCIEDIVLLTGFELDVVVGLIEGLSAE